MITGIGDESGGAIESQIAAAQALGWTHLEVRAVESNGTGRAALHDIPEDAFRDCVQKLEAAKISVYCVASTIMNWSTKVTDDFSSTLETTRRCIQRMKRLDCKLVRIMSHLPDPDEDSIPTEVFRRVWAITEMFTDSGIQPIHENCMNWGSISWEHALKLLDKVPKLKWVYDTGNPICNSDRSKPKPWPRQDPWEFWKAIRDHVVHIHVKDAIWNPAKNDADFTWPGEGEAKVREVLTDAFARGYSGAISIEPHMVVVFHDAESKADDAITRANFVDYGRRLEKVIGEIQGRKLQTS